MRAIVASVLSQRKSISPFALSLSKRRCQWHGPFDNLRANGKEILGHHTDC
jgi:hypothetical protein